MKELKLKEQQKLKLKLENEEKLKLENEEKLKKQNELNNTVVGKNKHGTTFTFSDFEFRNGNWYGKNSGTLVAPVYAKKLNEIRNKSQQ